jgi:DNA invertase Pin-like site-specific DNA recombinase
MALIGYARVSTEDQNTAPQLAALRDAGCTEIFEEHASGGDRTRRALAQALARCRAGDVLVTAKIDRLARSLDHLLQIIAQLEARGAGFRSLGDPIDTTSPQGRFTLQILGAVAEFERALIRERTRAGIQKAVREKRIGNPGLRAKDVHTVERMARARADRRADELAGLPHGFFSIVRDLRPAHPWDTVMRVLNARQLRRLDGEPWTRDSLIRATRRLVASGLLPADCLKAAPKRTDTDHHVSMVAALANALPHPTLQAIGAELERMRERTPRGGIRWSPGSVKHLLDKAKGLGLIREWTDDTSTEAIAPEVGAA